VDGFSTNLMDLETFNETKLRGVTTELMDFCMKSEYGVIMGAGTIIRDRAVRRTMMTVRNKLTTGNTFKYQV
jgi:hypothetical protein